MSAGYVKFATEHNALFNLMIDRPDKFTGEPEWLEATQNPRKILDKFCSKTRLAFILLDSIAVAELDFCQLFTDGAMHLLGLVGRRGVQGSSQI